MAAGTSVIQREVSLSALSISQPAVINSRPFSHRIQSARLLVPQGQHFEGDRSFITRSHKFPHAGTTGVSVVDTTLPHGEVQQQEKSSTFANFRLLQRLAVSARSRVSCEAEEDPQNHISKLNSSQKGDDNKSCYLEETFESDLVGSALSALPPTSLKDPEKNVKVKKSHRKKAKKPFKKSEPSQDVGSQQPASVNHLQLTSSKAVTTFSKRFSRHRKAQNRKRNSTERLENSFPDESSSCYHSASSDTLSEDARIPVSSLTSNNLIAGLEGSSAVLHRESVQETNLRAIYESCNISRSIKSVPSKKVRLKKLFQSEKQSGSLSEYGRLLPCAPPASPTLLTLEKYEIIPSLADFRSQQSIKQRLKALQKDAKKKQTVREKQKQQQEMEILQARQEEQRIRTRQEIYALNKIMTKLERDHFKKFQEQMKNR